MNSMRETPARARVPWLLVLVLALAPLTAAAQAPAAPDAKGVGMITTYAGQVRVSRAVKPGQAVAAALTPVKIGQAVFPHDVIETQAKSRAQVLFQDDSILNVAEKTRLEITEAVYDPVQGSRQSVLKLQEGKVRAIISRFLTGGQSKFEIHTPTTVAAARGTEVIVHHIIPSVITEPPRTILVLISGSLLAQSTDEKVVGTVTLTPGTRVEVQPGVPPPPPTPVPPNELRQLLRDTTVVRAEAKEEAEKKAAEATAKAEEAKKKAEEAKAKAEEAKKKAEEAKKKEEEAGKKAEEAEAKEADAKTKADKEKQEAAAAEAKAKAAGEAAAKAEAEAKQAEAKHGAEPEGEAKAKARAEMEAKAAEAKARVQEAEAARGEAGKERVQAAEAETFHATMKQDMLAVQQEVETFRQDVVLAQGEVQQMGQFMAAAVMDVFVATFHAEMLAGGATLGEVALPGDRPLMLQPGMLPPGALPPGMTPPPGMELTGEMLAMQGMLPGTFDYTTALQTVTDTFTTFTTNITNQLVTITQTTTVPTTGTTGTVVEFQFPQPSNINVNVQFP